jgi:hypothetical protein
MSLPGEQTAKTFIDALKEQPLSLALVVMNLCLLAYLYYAAIVAHNERAVETKLMYENRTAVAQMLANCYPAKPQ